MRPGEPYEPLDVDVLFDEPTVALRGPWSPPETGRVAPSADDLVGRLGYFLDFPGDALDPECDYERWARASPREPLRPSTRTSRPTRHTPGTRAPVLALLRVQRLQQPARGRLGDDPARLRRPRRARGARRGAESIGFSSHEGAERADWGDEKLELADGVSPIVYPAAGSHANKFTEALYIGSSAEAGVGCDDTRGPHVELRPNVETIPSDLEAAREEFPWIAFEGRWGERQRAFFNGPTGPNLKTQWSEPIEWSEGWRERSYAVPTSGVLGTDATDFFCSAVETGSSALVSLLRNPQLTLLILGALLGLVVLLATRTVWRPVAPLRLGRRRTWGQIIAAAGRMYCGVRGSSSASASCSSRSAP